MPKRGPDWKPCLSWHGPRQCGRVRLPGVGIKYLGKLGCWKSKRQKPPAEVVEEYDREVARWLLAKNDRDGKSSVKGPIAKGCTISSLVRAYVRYARDTYRKRDAPTSHVRSIVRAMRELVQLYGSTRAEDFRAADLRVVRDTLERTGKLNRRSINYQIGRIRRMFRWGASERELFSEDVWVRLKAVPGLQRHRSKAREPGKEKPVSDELVDATLPHLPAVVQAMVKLQRVTGMRPLEVCYMRAEDITEEADGIWRYEVGDAGNKLSHRGIVRRVFLGKEGRAILKPWLMAVRKRGGGWVFCKRIGKGPILPNRYGDIVRETCDAQGIERWHVRQLRHVAGTETRKKYGKEGAQAQLGHLEPETTEGYTNTALEDLARRIARETG